VLAHKDETGLRGACRHASRCRTEAVRAVFLLRTRGVKFGVLSVKNRDISKMGHGAGAHAPAHDQPAVECPVRPHKPGAKRHTARQGSHARRAGAATYGTAVERGGKRLLAAGHLEIVAQRPPRATPLLAL